MTKLLEIREVTNFLSLLNKATNFMTVIKTSKSAPELEKNLTIVESELNTLKKAKTGYIRKTATTIDKDSRQSPTKLIEVERKVISLHREASTLQNIILGLHNYTTHILALQARTGNVPTQMVEEFRYNLSYVDKSIQDMLGIASLSNNLQKLTSSDNQGAVALDSRLITKLKSLQQNTANIIQNSKK